MNKVSHCLKIKPERESYIPTYVNVGRLEELWKRNENQYVPSWAGDPVTTWFEWSRRGERKTHFCTADALVGSEDDGRLSIGFLNGRHRTRWSITLGLDPIPIGLEEEDYQLAKSIGLAIRHVNSSDIIVLRCKTDSC